MKKNPDPSSRSTENQKRGLHKKGFTWGGDWGVEKRVQIKEEVEWLKTQSVKECDR